MVQKTLVPKPKRATQTRVINPFNAEKEKLHELHKRLRAGLVVWNDVSVHEQELLRKYYGW